MKKTLLLFFIGACGFQQSFGQPCTATVTASGPTTFCPGGSVGLSANSGNSWTQKANFGGTARRGAVGFSIGTKGYMGTGATDQAGTTLANDFWEYDSNTDTWSQKANFAGGARKNATGIAIGSKGYVGLGVAGSVYNEDFWEYNPTSNSWTRKEDYKGKECAGAFGFSIGSLGYVGGGFDGKKYQKDFYNYNPSTNKWDKLKEFGGKERAYAVGFSIGNSGYVGTGTDGKIDYTDFWEYNPTNNKWGTRASLPGGVRSYASGFSIGTKGFIGIGFSRASTTIRNDFWEYSPTTNSWVQRASYTGGPTFDAASFSIGSKGYIGTGSNGANTKNDFWQYSPNQTYLWSNGQTTPSITVSSGGSYSVTITTSTGCVATSSPVVVSLLSNAGIASATAAASPICSNSTTTLTANGVSGTNAIVKWYSTSGGVGTSLGSGNMLLNVGPGTYYARVTADCGNAAEASVTVASIPVTYSDTTVATCTSFGWNDSVYTASGNYTFMTTNAAGCDSIATLHLTIFPPVEYTVDKTDVTCYGSIDGTITINPPTSGLAPYSYRVGIIGGFSPLNAPVTTYNLKPGNYRVYVQDANGCVGVVTPVTVGQPARPSATIVAAPTSCNGFADGKITISNPTGQGGPYMYKIGTAGTYAPLTSPYDVTGLKAGNYGVYIMDMKGCEGPAGVASVTQPLKLSATISSTAASCYGVADGSLTIDNPVNGIAPYQYKLRLGDSYQSLVPPTTVSNIKGANYKVYLQDAVGCTSSVAAPVDQPAAVVVNFSITPIDCSTPTGTIMLSSSAGATFKLNPGGVYTPQNTYSGLAAGSYYGYANDITGCTGRSDLIVLNPATGCGPIANLSATADQLSDLANKISLLPNPSSYQFTLRANSSTMEPVSIRVMDANGKIVYQAKGMSYQSFKFGETFSNGIYMIEVRQGNSVKTFKAVKGR